MPFGPIAPISLFQGRSEREQCRFERRQIVFDGLPNDRGINALIVVPQDVAYPGDILPANILVLRFRVGAEMAAG
jgi:hypothetical protein